MNSELVMIWWKAAGIFFSIVFHCLDTLKGSWWPVSESWECDKGSNWLRCDCHHCVNLLCTRGVQYVDSCSDCDLVPSRCWDVLPQTSDDHFSCLCILHTLSLFLLQPVVYTENVMKEPLLSLENLIFAVSYFNFRLVCFHPTLWKKLQIHERQEFVSQEPVVVKKPVS
jgi:hypothetical protein